MFVCIMLHTLRQLTFELTQKKNIVKFLRSLQVQELMPEAESLGMRLPFIIHVVLLLPVTAYSLATNGAKYIMVVKTTVLIGECDCCDSAPAVFFRQPQQRMSLLERLYTLTGGNDPFDADSVAFTRPWVEVCLVSMSSAVGSGSVSGRGQATYHLFDTELTN